MTWPDDVADFLALDSEQRRVFLLASLDNCSDSERGENFILRSLHDWFPDLMGLAPLSTNVPGRQDQRHAADSALRDAYAALMAGGLIRPNPSSGKTFCALTDLGRTALEEAAQPDAGRVTFAREALAAIDLHPALKAREVDSHFRQGKYETALRDGGVFLEDAIRNLASLGSSGLVGVKLVSKAFSNTGKLTDPNQHGGEQAGLRALYEGFVGVIRNQVAHKEFCFASNKEAFQALMLLDYLTERLAEAAIRLSLNLT